MHANSHANVTIYMHAIDRRWYDLQRTRSREENAKAIGVPDAVEQSFATDVSADHSGWTKCS